MSCPHTVFERVEFAEGDSFFYSPDANHHIECFDIVGSVVLRVVYLFHIPYQIYWCKDIKNPPHFATGRDSIEKSNHFANMLKRTTTNIVNINGKTKPLLVLLSGGA